MTILIDLDDYYAETHFGRCELTDVKHRQPVVRIVRKRDGLLLRFSTADDVAYNFLWRFANDGPGEKTRAWLQEFIDWHESAAKRCADYWEKPEAKHWGSRRYRTADEFFAYPPTEATTDGDRARTLSFT